MPTPYKGEKRDDFINRCVPIVLAEKTAKTQGQAAAICISMWEKDKK